MRSRHLPPFRQRVLEPARGVVLELGIGSGLNVGFYPAAVERLIGVEPSAPLLALARRAVATAPFPVTLLQASAESLPLPDASVDTVVTTWTLCSIPDVGRALVEARRVLRPDGRLLFVEHGLAPEPGVQEWQRRLTPLWRRCSGGCHLDRPIAELIAEAGFRFERLEAGSMPGPRLVTYMTEGSARTHLGAPGD
ncbi:MAG: class I SAM-dependent methyltransferase [Alphaproteobacteria bacterium]|nr:class I SAM-dependent methyltransferase [Alphaproteobacteria bacterium]